MLRLCWLLAATLAVALSAAVAACSPAQDPPSPDHGEEGVAVRVGAGPDAETQLLAHVVVAMLDLEQVAAEVVAFTDTRDVQHALEVGRIDLRPAYSGERWLESLAQAAPPADPRASIAGVREHDAELGLVWLQPRFGEGIDEPPANATFAFMVLGPPGAHADLRTMSQLATRLSERPEAAVCVDREFAERPDGLRAVLEAYSVRSDRPFLAADPAEAVVAVAAGDCIAGLTTATDGTAWRSGLRPLADDLRVFPAFVPLPQVREEVLDEHPGVRRALIPVATQLTTALLGSWNAQVAAGESMPKVAREAAAELSGLAGRTVVEPDDA